MGCTELTLIPIAEAMAAPRPMGYRAGRTTLGNLGSKDGMSDGLVFSRHSAAAPSTPNRSCQPDAGLGLTGCRMISAVALPIGCQGPVTFARPDMLLRTPPNETTASSQLSPVAAPV
jgi:hypothetical protein